MIPSCQASADLSWACLNLLTKRRYDYLIGEYGSISEAWGHLDQALLQKLGCKEETILKSLNEAEELDTSKHEAFLKKNDIQFITIEDDSYPDVLRDIADPPVFLFAKGNLGALKEPAIAIVGTRAMSAYGKRVVETIIPEFVNAGLTTVSGLAMGIDAQVAKETIAAGGQTVAVLGHGLASIYPRANARLAEEIVKSGGLLLTEFPLHITPNKFTFPARNRIIAGLSLGTVVAEAASQSGSLITASLALEYGKEVFAIPGPIFDPNMEGTHHLIQKSGAKLITSAADVLCELGIVSSDKSKSNYHAQTPAEKTVYENLSSMPQSVDALAEKSQLTVAEINATLTLMELKGGVKNVGMGQWVRD